MIENDTNKHNSNRHVNLWIGLASLIVFLIFASVNVNNTMEKLNKQLETKTALAYNELSGKLRSGIHVLNGFSAYFDAIDDIDYNKLEDFSVSIREQNPHIYMTQYMVRVPKNELDDFINERNKAGYATYRVTQLGEHTDDKMVPASNRSVYYPLVFMNPLTVRNAPLLGYDAYSSPIIHEAIDKAIELGENYSTKPYKIFGDGLGYLIVRPIFTSDNPPQDKKIRHELATRLVAVLIRINDLIKNIDIDSNYSLQLSHYDQAYDAYTDVGNKQKHKNNNFILPTHKDFRRFDIAGQSFQLTVERQVQWNDFSYEWIAFSLFITGAVSLLLYNFIHLRIESATERKRARAALYREKELAEVTLHSIGEAVITTDNELKIKYMNPVATRLSGWDYTNVIGKPLEEILHLVNEQTRERVHSSVNECLELESTVIIDEPTLLINKNGDEYAIESSAAPISSHNGKIIGAVLVLRNVTHLRNLSKKMEFQASHDSLTELINRREFEHQLKLAVKSAREKNHQHALCYLDLDQFKVVNDTCGHIAGDQLLRELSKIMPECIRASDCLARLGGDEFGVLMFDCPLHQAKKVAESIRTTIKDFTFSWDKKTFDIGVSIGLVPINNNSGSLQDIMRRADSSCYIAKDKGRNRIHIYTPDDYELTKRQGEMQWLTRIQQALDGKRFQLALQSIRPTDHRSYEPIHYEVLLRMQDENGNIIPPMSFIPAAERYDMMSVLDKWVITTTFNMISNELKQGKLVNIYNINLSGQTLSNPEISDFIRQQVKNYRIPPENLCFEITETAVIANLGLAIDFINDMKKIGCMFALDDFGSGLSSFTYLKKLPVDYLKIDGEFIRDILVDPMDLAIVAAINDIGHEMGLKTVAEYVENTETLELLKSLGVDYVQGYGIEKPRHWIADNVIPLKKQI